MSGQNHRIMRQVLEIRGCPSGQAWRIQNEIQRIYYQRIVPLMETAFARVSSPDRILRINTLEIDLGAVPLDALEQALCSEFEKVFASELTTAARQAQKAFGGAEDVTLASQLELFSYYLKTGVVPWWADLARRNLLERNLEFLIQQAPVALAQVMQELGNQDQALRRIVLSYPDHLLDGLSSILAPQLWAAFPGFTRELVALLQTAGASKSRSPSFWRTLLWEETLRLANTRDVSALEPFSFFRAIFMRLAHRSGVAYRSLISDIDESLKAQSSNVHLRVAAIVQSLYREICPAAAKSGPEAESTHAELVELLERFDGSGLSTADLLVRLRMILDRLPLPSLAQALAKLKLWASRATAGETLTSELIDELAGPSSESPLPSTTASLSPASTPGSEGGPKVVPPPESFPRKRIRRTRHNAVKSWKNLSDLSFSDSDEIYVNNSGLVILWPFLNRFFKHLGLVEEKKFKDEAAVQRSVGLLQYLVSENTSPPEYLLPLNKVLCGMALDKVFDFGPPVTEVEIEECRQLLTLAIQRAPILHNMSIPGFRNTFLLRKGQLSARDGLWRLRVERETYDVVLDRFPWSVSWLKLPWMEFPMHVEW
jgi:hypothetical protein